MRITGERGRVPKTLEPNRENAGVKQETNLQKEKRRKEISLCDCSVWTAINLQNRARDLSKGIKRRD